MRKAVRSPRRTAYVRARSSPFGVLSPARALFEVRQIADGVRRDIAALRKSVAGRHELAGLIRL